MEKETNQRCYEKGSDEMKKEGNIGKSVGDDKRAKSYIFLYFVFLVFFFMVLVLIFGAPLVDFVVPTPGNNTNTANSSIVFNTSITEVNLTSIVWNWNGVNYTIFNNSLELFLNFNNVSFMGENDTLVVPLNFGAVANGTSNATMINNGKYGGAILLDGKNGVVKFASDIEFQNGLTWIAWINTSSEDSSTGYTGNAALNVFGDYKGSITVGFGVHAGKVRYNHYNTSWLTLDGGSYVNDSQWHQIVVTHNKSSDNVTIYVDGVIDASVNMSYNTARSHIKINRIGGGYAYGGVVGYGDFFNGSIDDVMLWSVPLTPETVYQLYASSLTKYGVDDWSLYVNQSKNASDLLDESLNTYQTFVTNGSDDLNFSGIRSITANSIRPLIEFVGPTPANYVNTTNTSLVFNVSITEANLDRLIWNWNGSNETIINVSSSGVNVSFTGLSTLSNFTFNNGSDSVNLFNDGLILMMNFDNVSSLGENDTLVVDLSGEGNNGTGIGEMLANVSGRYGGAFRFDGKDDYVTVSESDSTYLNETMAISFWFKHNDNDQTNKGMVTAWNGALVEWAITTGVNTASAKGLHNYIRVDGKTTKTIFSNITINDSMWHNNILTYNGSDMFTYTDGIVSGTLRFVGPINNSNNDILIGQYSNLYYNGTIDQVLIFSRSLSATEIALLYSSSLAKYDTDKWRVYSNDSGNYSMVYTFEGSRNDTIKFFKQDSDSYNFYINKSNLVDDKYTYQSYVYDKSDNYNTTGSYNITVDSENPNATILLPVNDSYNLTSSINFTVNISDNLGVRNATLNLYQEGNSWLEFDGDGDVVKANESLMNDSISISNGTISLWVRMRKHTSQNFLWAKGVYYGAISLGSAGNVRVYSDPQGTHTSTAAIFMNDSSWDHIAVSWNDTNSSVYINGVLDSTTHITFADMTSVGYPGIISLGGLSGNAGYSINGSLDEFRIYNRSLSTLEIETIYRSGLVRNSNLNSSKLVVWYDFENSDGDNTNLQDYSVVSNNGSITGANFSSVSKSVLSFVADVTSGIVGVVVGLADQVYTWFYELFDWAGNSFATVNNTFTVDTLSPLIEFVGPTPANYVNTTNTSLVFNVSISEANLDRLIWNWNGSNFTMFNDSLVLFMNFNNLSSLGENDTLVVDVSGYGNNGTAVNGLLANSSGRYGGSFAFDGVNDYVRVNDDDSLNITSNFSVSLWFMDIGNPDVAIVASRSPSSSKGWSIDFNSSNFIKFYIGTGSWTNVDLTIPSVNEWHHLVGTYNGTDIVGYIDGIQNDITAKTGIMIGATSVTTIGAFNRGPEGSFLFNGSIDDVMILNRSLTSDEIAQLYMTSLQKYDTDKWSLWVNQTLNASDLLVDGNYTYQSIVYDKSDNFNASSEYTITVDSTNPNATILLPVNDSYNLTASINFTVNISDNLGVKNATLNLYQEGNSWLDFDGVDDYVDVGNNGVINLTSYTITAWFKNTNTANQCIYCEARTTNNNPLGGLEINAGKLRGDLRDDATTISTIDSTSDIDDDEWHHGVFVQYNKSNRSLFLDGILEVDDTTLLVNITTDNSRIGVLERTSKILYFNGSIDELRIYNRSLTSLEIETIYRSGLVRNSDLNSSGLVAWYDFENTDGNATNLTDYSGLDNNGTISGAVFSSVSKSVLSFVADVTSGIVGVVVGLADQVYTWFYELFDWAGNSFATVNNTFTIDTLSPLIDFVGPTPNNDSGASGSFQINVTMSDINLANISYTWNNTKFVYGENFSLFTPGNLTRGLVLMYNFDNLSAYGENDTHVFDFSAGKNNGTGNGSLTGGFGANVSGKYGGAFAFDGKDDYVTAGGFSFSANAPKTYSVWFKSSTVAGRTILNHVGVSHMVYLYFSGSTTLQSWMNGGPASFTIPSAADNQWHQLTYVYTGTAERLFFDGVQAGSDNVEASPAASSSTLYIGSASTIEFWNGSIDEVRIWNRSLSQDEVTQLYQSSLKKFGPNETLEWTNSSSFGNFSSSIKSTNGLDWEILINQSGLVVGESYDYNLVATDLASNSNNTGLRTINGNSEPTFDFISYSPNSTDDVDPNVTILVTVNVSDSDSNFDSAVLQYRNLSDGVGSWVNVSMVNTSVKGASTVLNASFVLNRSEISETNYTFRIWANDTVGGTAYSSNTTLNASWDCTWQTISALGAFTGWDANKEIVNITLNNTGDLEFSNNNCSLDFRLTYDIAEGRVFFDQDSIKPSNTFTVSAGSSLNVSVNASFLSDVNQEDVVVTSDEIRGRSNASEKNITLTLVSSQAGPYLYQTITSSPVSVDLTPGNFSLNGYLRNLLGGTTVNISNTAYNVTYNWTLPSGLENQSGILGLDYGNISNNSLLYNPINVTFSDLESMTSGIKIVNLYVSGVNISGDAISDATNNTLLVQQVNISFQCYNVTDTICVTDCGNTQDPDCPVETVTVGGSSGGGGGGGSGDGGVESRADYQIVRGKQNEVVVNFVNREPNRSITGLKFRVLGSLSKYLELVPKEISYVGPGEEYSVTLKIVSPTYLKLGRQTLTILVEGRTGSAFYTESKRVTLDVHEISEGDASELLEKSKDLLKELEGVNLSYSYLDDLLEEMEGFMLLGSYGLVSQNYDLIEKEVTSALEAKKIIDELESLIIIANEKNIDASASSRLLRLAKISLERRDFAEALSRTKEAQLIYALEVKGKLGRITYYVKKYPAEFSISLLTLILFSFGTFKATKLGIIKRKLRRVKEEQAILNQLIGIVQKECFNEKKMSMDEYRNAIKEYNKKLSVAIYSHIELENKRAHLLKFSNENKRLRVEKENVIKLLKELQSDYLVKGRIETRTYELKLESYNKRITEIEEKLATLEAKQAFKKGFGLFKLLRVPKKFRLK